MTQCSVERDRQREKLAQHIYMLVGGMLASADNPSLLNPALAALSAAAAAAAAADVRDDDDDDDVDDDC